MNPAPTPQTPPALPPAANLAASDLNVLAFLWGKVGTFAFLVSLAALLGMMSQQGPFDTLKIPELGAYTLTLFTIPLLSAMIVFLAWIGRCHVRMAPSLPGSTVAPVGWKISGLGTSGLRTQVAAMSVIVCLGIPMVVDVWSLCKFAHGTYYWEPPHGGTCKDPKPDEKTCVVVGTILTAFWPTDHDIGNPLHTQYLYQGNKDFVPVIQPLAYLAMVLGALWTGTRFIFRAFSAPRSPPGPGLGGAAS